MALRASFSRGGKSTRCNSPRMRRIGGLPVDKCKSDALCSSIKLKKASILAILSVLEANVIPKPGPCPTNTPAGHLLREEIQRSGPITFARFMEIALYCPKIGYYERAGAVGAPEGDFYTSVTATPLFAELLAFQFAEWLQELGNRPFALVEAGAHDGSLARGILSWLRAHRPEVLERITYYIVESSEERKGWQTRQLDIFARQIRWVERLDLLPALHGIIFSNELLDAMPVHRFTWRAAQREWRETGVGLEGDQFVWADLSVPALDLASEFSAAGFEFPEELQAVLPEGYCIELSPEARQWWRGAADRLENGKLLTIDYGLEAQEFLAPQRQRGTLRSYRQ